MLNIQTPSGKWEAFVRQIEGFLASDIIELVVNGENVRGYRSPDSPALWIRDHSDIMRGGKFFEANMKSTVEAFAKNQTMNGLIYDNVQAKPTSTERENWEKWIRIQVEADVEYRFVKAGFLAWQATGDTAWMKELLPNFERALQYTLTDKWRWDTSLGLVKRPYTIDTWDFDYTAGRHPWLNFAVTDHTFWGISHSDNSGMVEACNLLSAMYEAAGNKRKWLEWYETGKGIRERANKLLFNGRFYTHFHKITPVTIEGVNEAEQLSFSNPMAINRGMATPEISRAILQEYQTRRETSGAFAEWFGIHPPFPKGIFGEEKLVEGAYINGGIFPLCGGELAKAAFDHQLESYGVSILEQYRTMIEQTGETYLWYFPDGTASSEETSTSPEAMPTDGWGSSSMLYGLVEGLGGVTDTTHSFRQLTVSPRWLAANEDYAKVEMSYAASGASFSYEYQHDVSQQVFELSFEGESNITCRVPVPQGKTVSHIQDESGRVIRFNEEKSGGSTYVRFLPVLRNKKRAFSVHYT
jgi:hypothetical protein